MARTAIVFGVLLIGVTLATIAYNMGFKSGSVFIPAGLGAAIAALGGIALNDGLRKHAMHAASALGLLGGVACLGMGFKQLSQLSSDNPPGVDKLGSVWGTATLCLVFVALCVRSFIQARRDKAKVAAD